MNNIWIFGDSFSRPFDDNIKYCKWKNYTPKTYADLLAEKLNLNLEYCAHGGVCNYSIYENFMDNIMNIKNDDIIIFGWTEITRFRLSNDDSWLNINSHSFNTFENFYKINNICNRTYFELIYNRTYKPYYNELNSIIKFINYIMSKNIIIHWSWVNYEYNINLTIPYFKGILISNETNNEVLDHHYSENDHLLLYNKILSYIKYREKKYSKKII